MQTFTHSKADRSAKGESVQGKFMRLTADERRELLLNQAKQMKDHYKQTAEERAEWQAGDFIEEYQNGI